MELTVGMTMLYSGGNNGNHRNGVGMLYNDDTNCLDEWTPVNECNAIFVTVHQNNSYMYSVLTENKVDTADKENYYEAAMQSTPKHDL
jgi:hypothetical protein